ncbi:hypothetical protein BDZ45DRAFT_755417 [Acephala macrosclerotiorum]|nr:hypothetical protein BDZ45DRAFT_755417 [Acephala macrosclerotiorum]
MEAPKWEFVNFDKLVKKQGEGSQKLVRAAAMRAFRRRERLRRVETFQKSEVNAPLLPITTCVHDFFNREALAGLAQGSGVAGTFHSDNSLVMEDDTEFDIGQHILNLFQGLTDLTTLDPCCTQALGLQLHQHYLLYHFSSIIAARPFRFATNKEQSPIDASWIRQVLQDEVILEDTFFSASVHLGRLHNRETSLTTLLHRGRTIQKINKTLVSREGVKDSVIAAVVLMAWSGDAPLPVPPHR